MELKPKIVRLCGRPNLPDYGIQIPLESSRADQVEDYLREAGLLNDENFEVIKPSLLTRQDIARSHSEDFLSRIFEHPGDVIKECYELVAPDGSYHRYDPSKAIINISELAKEQILEASATMHACQIGLNNGFCYFLGGGMHHARKSEPAGFCMINDIVISLRKLQSLGVIKSAWVIDTDAHKGDGTAEVTYEDSSIKTLSIHMAEGWPLEDKSSYVRDKAPWVASDIDIGVQKGGESTYLDRLGAGLVELINESDGKAPDFAVVVNGSDPYEKDALKSSEELKLSLDQLLQRDRLVFNFLKKLNTPQTWVMAGGYGTEVFEVHAQFLKSVISSN